MTEQEEFWSGAFGDEYTARNYSADLVINNVDFFQRVLKAAGKIKTVFEVGCNRGLNLAALNFLDPDMKLSGIDVNGNALMHLAELFEARNAEQPVTSRASIVDYYTTERFDLVFTKGVLIHLNPECLPGVYEKLYNLTSKYILLAEYYNPVPVEVEYRGNADKLFKRDFAGEMLDALPLELVEYGFVYHKETYPQDDLHWFLLKKEVE